jgi:hypothetical protein
MSFTFDPKSQRYRWASGIFAGRYMSRKDVEEVIEANITRIKGDIATITNLLVGNKITVPTWEEEIALAIKKGVIQSYIGGKGGTFQISQRDKRIVGNAIAIEYQYLRQFSKSILAGNLTPAQIRDRSSKYADSFHKYYALGYAEGHRLAKFLWERRITTPGDICADCQGYAAMGWQVIGSLPKIGTASQCRMRCRCYFEYSKSIGKPELSMFRRFGWVA